MPPSRPHDDRRVPLGRGRRRAARRRPARQPPQILVGAVAKALGPLFDIVRDTDQGPGWSAVLDPDRIVAMLPETVAQRVLGGSASSPASRSRTA
jgi:hypothetical protein